MKTRLLITILSVLLFATPVGAKDASEAIKEWKQDLSEACEHLSEASEQAPAAVFATALRVCKPEAERGNPFAQLTLAGAYMGKHLASPLFPSSDRFHALYWFMVARNAFERLGEDVSGIDTVILSLGAPQTELSEAILLANNFRPKGSGSWWKFWE